MAVNEEEEKPLDPAVERVRRKMVRLLAISIGIMMVGLMAVLASIVYKIATRQDETPASVVDRGVRGGTPVPGVEGRIRLPAGAELLSTALDGDHVLLRLRLAEGGEQLLIYSLGEDRIIAKVGIE